MFPTAFLTGFVRIFTESFGGKKNESWFDMQASSAGARPRLNVQNSAISLLRTDEIPPSAETLRDDLSSYKVDRVLRASPAMTTAYMPLSFGGHQLCVLSLFISAGVPGAGPEACGGQRGGGGGEEAPPQRTVLHCNLIQQHYHSQTYTLPM